MLTKDPVEIEKILMAELGAMPEEAVLTQARMFGVPVEQSSSPPSNDKTSIAASAPVNPYDDPLARYRSFSLESARHHSREGLSFESWLQRHTLSSSREHLGDEQLREIWNMALSGSTGGSNMDTVVSSAISFQKIFSMAKIRNLDAIPDYVELAVANNGAPCNDGWFGDRSDAEECTKYVCQYVAGGASFFFCFGRDPNASLMEAPSGEAFQFHRLFAKREDDWFSKDYSKEELKAVIDVINSSEDAVSDLGMEPSKINNPVYGSAGAGSVEDYQEGKLE